MIPKSWYAAATVAVTAALLVSACGSSSTSESTPSTAAEAPDSGGETKELVIGYPYAATGGYAAFDAAVFDGMQFAADQINAENGPLKIKIVAQDHKTDQTTGLAIAQDMIAQGINAFVVTTTPMNIAMGTEFAKSGAVISMGLVSPPTVHNAIGDRAFSISEPQTNVQAAAMAEHACANGYKKAFILESGDMDYTSKPGGYFLDAFAKICGGTLALRDTYKIGATDFSSQVTKIMGSDADFVFSSIFCCDSITFLKKLRGAGSELPFLSTDGQDTPAFVEAGGMSVEGTVFATAAFPTEGSNLEKFMKEFTAATGAAPTSNEYEAVGRDNIYAFAEAAKNANYDLSPDALIEGFKQIKELELATGTATMISGKNTASKPVAVVAIKDGKPTLVSFDTPTYLPAG